jgi:hypothetical protein
MVDDPPSHSIAFSISREGGICLDLAFIDINRLLLHEETIPQLLDALTEEIEREGVIEDPVIVDRETLVVLDGMHRVKALRRLGCKLIPVCLVDYSSPEIRVERWCRTVKNEGRLGELTQHIKARALEVKATPIDEAKRLLEAKKAVGLLETRAGSYALLSERAIDVFSSFRAISEVEEDLRAEGFEVGYETEQDAERKLGRRELDAVILPPKIGKREIIENAVRGEVFIPKATRHIIPARPLGISIPLSLLRAERLSPKEAEEACLKLLKERTVKRIPPGSLWKGRRYDEELYVFE